jgi:hypothetical protein
LTFKTGGRSAIITVGVAIVLVAATCVGLTWHLASRSAFFVGVAITLAFWGAAFGLPPSYTNALWLVLGLVGSAVFWLTGTLAWWRVRTEDRSTQWPWIVGSALAIAPVILLGALYLVRR